MKILHTVEFYHPSIGGSQEVVRQLSERLVRRGHDVTVVTTSLKERKQNSLNGVQIRSFEISGNAVHGYKGDTNAYKQFLKDSNFDVIMNYAAQQWTSDLFFDVIDEIRGAKVLVPCGYSGLPLAVYGQYFASLPAILRKYSATVYLGNNFRDIIFARKHKIGGLHIIPNGASPEEFNGQAEINIRKQLGISPGSCLVLLVGSHTGIKGHTEAMKLFHQSAIPGSTLLLVGNDVAGGCIQKCQRFARIYNLLSKFKGQNSNIIIASLNRKQTIAVYYQSDIFLLPSNVEASPIVLFESMAAGLPFLATDVGNSREIVEWTGAGMILPTTFDANGQSHAAIKASAQVLRDLASNTDKQTQLSKAGLKAWHDRFNWGIITTEYEKLYQSLIP